jgi:predicted AlkP superfamily pyrophosphatase or phosphodiesterase
MANLVYIDLMADFIQSTEESSGLFMFYHCDLPHTPFAINKDGNLIDEGYPEPSIPSFYNAPAAYYTAKKTFDLILDFTDALKKQNLYDNTIIVIASDHGNPYFDNDINIKEKSVMQNVDYSRAQTLFLVKGINEKGPLQTRDDLVSSADILSYLYSSGAFIKDVDILDFPPTKREERIYSCLAVSYADLVEKDSVPYRSYSVKGPLADINSWTAKEKE